MLKVLQRFYKNRKGVKTMVKVKEEPIKVNAYRVITAFTANETIWWVMSDGKVVLIVKPNDT